MNAILTMGAVTIAILLAMIAYDYAKKSKTAKQKDKQWPHPCFNLLTSFLFLDDILTSFDDKILEYLKGGG